MSSKLRIDSKSSNGIMLKRVLMLEKADYEVFWRVSDETFAGRRKVTWFSKLPTMVAKSHSILSSDQKTINLKRLQTYDRTFEYKIRRSWLLLSNLIGQTCLERITSSNYFSFFQVRLGVPSIDRRKQIGLETRASNSTYLWPHRGDSIQTLKQRFPKSKKHNRSCFLYEYSNK